MYLKSKLNHCCYLTVTVKLLLSVIYWRSGERAAPLYSRVTDPPEGGKKRRGRGSPLTFFRNISFALRHKNVLYIFITNADIKGQVQPSWNVQPTSRFHTNVPIVGVGGRFQSPEEDREGYSYQRLQTQTSPPCSLLTGPARRRTHKQ